MANDVFDKVRVLIDEIEQATVQDLEALEAFRIRFLGSKNILKPLMGEIRNVPNEQKRDYGRGLNELKKEIESKLAEAKKNAGTVVEAASGRVKVKSRPARSSSAGWIRRRSR